MKTLRQLSVALVFIFALTMPAFAGEISTGIAPPTPPAAATAGQIETMTAGQIETTVNSEATANDSVTNIALNLLQSVLSLF